MTDSRRADVTEWLHYLQDIGVRELRAGGAVDAVPISDEALPDGSAATLEAAPSPEGAPPSAAAPRSGELFGIGSDEDDDEHDPIRRLAEVREELGDCTRCKLHEGRTNLVFGVGDPRAKLMFIGEGPGADEDAQGEPFVGRAGKKLNEMIQAIGLRREDVYIANVVKCRPPKNRDPENDEVSTCSPYLFQQIEAIRPGVIVTLGAPAARTVLGIKTPISRIRGSWHSCRGVPVMPTFHPAYLLRVYTPENRRKVWDDLKAARRRMDEER